MCVCVCASCVPCVCLSVPVFVCMPHAAHVRVFCELGFLRACGFAPAWVGAGAHRCVPARACACARVHACTARRGVCVCVCVWSSALNVSYSVLSQCVWAK